MSKARRQHLMHAMRSALAEAEKGELPRAISSLKRANVLAEEAPAVVFFHASLLIAAQRWTEALSLLDQLLNVRPDSARFQLSRATCLIGMGRLDEARALLERKDTMRGSFLCSVLLARIAAREGDLQKSASLLREACSVNELGGAMVARKPALAAILEGNVNVPHRPDGDTPVH